MDDKISSQHYLQQDAQWVMLTVKSNIMPTAKVSQILS